MIRKIGANLQVIDWRGPYGSFLAIVLAPKRWNIFEVGLTSTYTNYVPAFLLSLVHDRNEKAYYKTEPSISKSEPANPFERAREVQQKGAILQGGVDFRDSEVMRPIMESK